MVSRSRPSSLRRDVLVGRSRTTARRFSVGAVGALVVFAALFSLLVWDHVTGSAVAVVGFWLLLGGWTLLAPVVNAYENDGLLVSWLLASVGPFAVGAVLALSPALTGSQHALVDVFGFALELAVEYGLPAGAVGFALGSWMRIARSRSGAESAASQVADRYAVLFGTVFLLAVPVVRVVWNWPGRVATSPVDLTVLAIAGVGVVAGAVLFRNLGEAS